MDAGRGRGIADAEQGCFRIGRGVERERAAVGQRDRRRSSGRICALMDECRTRTGTAKHRRGAGIAGRRSRIGDGIDRQPGAVGQRCRCALAIGILVDGVGDRGGRARAIGSDGLRDGADRQDIAVGQARRGEAERRAGILRDGGGHIGVGIGKTSRGGGRLREDRERSGIGQRRRRLTILSISILAYAVGHRGGGRRIAAGRHGFRHCREVEQAGRAVRQISGRVATGTLVRIGIGILADRARHVGVGIGPGAIGQRRCRHRQRAVIGHKGLRVADRGVGGLVNGRADAGAGVGIARGGRRRLGEDRQRPGVGQRSRRIALLSVGILIDHAFRHGRIGIRRADGRDRFRERAQAEHAGRAVGQRGGRVAANAGVGVGIGVLADRARNAGRRIGRLAIGNRRRRQRQRAVIGELCNCIAARGIGGLRNCRVDAGVGVGNAGSGRGRVGGDRQRPSVGERGCGIALLGVGILANDVGGRSRRRRQADVRNGLRRGRQVHHAGRAVDDRGERVPAAGDGGVGVGALANGGRNARRSIGRPTNGKRGRRQ